MYIKINKIKKALRYLCPVVVAVVTSGMTAVPMTPMRLIGMSG